jgi:hypothetical protein
MQSRAGAGGPGEDGKELQNANVPEQNSVFEIKLQDRAGAENQSPQRLNHALPIGV